MELELLSDTTSSENETTSDDEDNVDDVGGGETSTTRTKRSALNDCQHGKYYENFYTNPNTSPIYGNRMQLVARTQHFLAVYPDGKVRGTMDKSDLHTHLELINAGYPGHLRIKGLLTNLYVAVNQKGRIYAEANAENEKTVFIESIKGFYLTYLSRHFAYQGWYLAIKKSGRMKNARKTALQQKAAQFLQRRKEFE